MSCFGNNSVFGPSNKYIKFNGGDIVAIDGINTVEKLPLGDIKIPYEQIIRGRIILKPGQTNYLLNFFGLGDNATFLAIKATYNIKSVNEEDNYVLWNYSDDFAHLYPLGRVMVLTGNSTNRIKQIYLSNPSTKYEVILDAMVAVIDDESSFYVDTINQVGTSLTGLEVGDIQSYIIGESIVIYDKNIPAKPLLYIQLVNINAIERSGSILIIDDNSQGTLLLQFLTEYDAIQSHSLINYVLENPTVDIATIVPVEDTQDPVLYFLSQVGNNGDYISFNGATAGVPYDTSYGYTFSTSISLGTYGSYSTINKLDLIGLLIDYIDDNRDGTMGITASNLILTNNSIEVSNITSTGSYGLTFNFSDIAQNYLDGVIVTLDIIN
jgi:hypothetical protein